MTVKYVHTLKERTVLEKFKKRIIEIPAFNKVLLSNNGNFIESSESTKKMFKAVIYPKDVGSIGVLEITPKAKRSRSLEYMAQRFIKKSKIEEEDVASPKDAKELKIGDYSGILFFLKGKSKTDTYVCFTGYSDTELLNYRLLVNADKRDTAVKEMKRFLVEDLIVQE